MKTFITLIGVAAVGTLLMMGRGDKSKPLTFAGRALRMGGRLALVGAVVYRALRSGTKAVSGTMHEAGRQSAKAWNSEPTVSIQLK